MARFLTVFTKGSMFSSGIHVVREMGPPSGNRGRGGSEHELLSLPAWSISSNQLRCKWSAQSSTQCNAMRRHFFFLQLALEQSVLQESAKAPPSLHATPIGRQGTRLCKGRAFAMTNCWGSARMKCCKHTNLLGLHCLKPAIRSRR